MRIAFISYEYPPDSSAGGIATYVEQAALMQAARGHQVEVFASSPSRDAVVQSDGVTIHWIQETDRLDFGVVAGHRFAHRHAANPFDVLEGPEYNADARKAVALVPEIPLVVKMHTPSRMIAEINSDRRVRTQVVYALKSLKRVALEWRRTQAIPPITLTPGQSRYELYQLETEHAQRADIVAPPCEDLCRYAREVWRLPRDRVRFTPHPYTPRPEFVALQPRRDGCTVGFVGRLEKRKGIETLVRAIPRVLRAVPQARFRLIGAPLARPGTGQMYDQWVREQLRPHLHAIDMPGKATLDQMPAVYDTLDICAFPSLWENFPNVCLEAMAAGRAVIGSAAGGMAEMLNQGEVGRLVEPGQAEPLADQIIDLLKNPEERLRLGHAARQRVLVAYNQDVIGRMMEEVYLEAIQRKGSKGAEGAEGAKRPTSPPASAQRSIESVRSEKETVHPIG